MSWISYSLLWMHIFSGIESKAKKNHRIAKQGDTNIKGFGAMQFYQKVVCQQIT